MTLADFTLTTIYAIGLRWLVFRYPKFAWLQNWLSNSKLPALAELSSCVYCQTIEAAVVTNLLLKHYGVVDVIMSSLAIGLISTVINNQLEYWLEYPKKIEIEESEEKQYGWNHTGNRESADTD